MQLKELESINVTPESGIPQSKDTFNVQGVPYSEVHRLNSEWLTLTNSAQYSTSKMVTFYIH